MSATYSKPLHPGLNLGDKHGDDHLEAETSIFGFWVFMMSDLVTFGMFFAIYASSVHALAGGPGPKELFDIGSIAWQTAFLLLSSLTSGVAVLTMKEKHTEGERPGLELIFFLVLTMLLGMCFLFLEIADFFDMAEKGGVPTRSGYLTALWSLVSLHGLHVSMGVLWCGVIVVGLIVRGVDRRWKLAIMRWAIFWHFLDIVWIGIFSFVFLGGLN